MENEETEIARIEDRAADEKRPLKTIEQKRIHLLREQVRHAAEFNHHRFMPGPGPAPDKF